MLNPAEPASDPNAPTPADPRRAARSAALVSAMRSMMPLLHVYAGQAPRPADAPPSGADGPDRMTDASRFRADERSLLAASGQKAFVELIQMTSRTHPVGGTKAYEAARRDDSSVDPPNIGHVMSLFSAAGAPFRAAAAKQSAPLTAAPARSPSYFAVAQGEYSTLVAPEPADVRRQALAMRVVSAQQPAAPAAFAGSPRRFAAAQPPGAALRSPSSCGCGGGPSSGCSCGSGAASSFPAARRKADGTCESVFDISCDAQWRMRECFKTAFCHFLECVGEKCEDGQFPDMHAVLDCLETAACALVKCLPEAICPSEPPRIECVAPPAGCGCSFAVGE
jgi:hypothetical protein